MTDEYGFELIREEKIDEFNTLARLYRHEPTGAEVLSLINDDENKVFGITFRTPPADSTGLPHILEHSVLCGSRKYPVKEPFVELVKGSLNTFLNAMTFPDMTSYPVASQNLQDFYNLVDVYLDAVFFPRLTPYTLMQEGWHYEAEDSESPLEYKGVVFNEMKGVYSQPDNLLDDQVIFSLFPDTIYHHAYGGDPVAIPNLTYEKFTQFHETFYHPSNARIFFYGDDDPQMRLVILHEYLHLFEAIPVFSEIDLQPPFKESRRLEIPYEISADQQDAKAFVTLNWLLPEGGDTETTLGMAVLEYVLVGTPAAQLRKAMIDSGLGEDITGRGIETGTRQMFFSTGLKGVALDKVDEVEKLIISTLASLAINGVDPENIAAAMNTIEFRLRENNTGSYPRGLAIMLRSMENWIHGRDPISPLQFERPLQAIKDRIQSGDPYFEHLIEAFLVNNTHRTTVVLKPDAQLSEKREAAEREKLDQARSGMDDAALSQVIENARRLKELQETPDSPEALSTIPMLERDDLEPNIRKIPVEVFDSSQRKILYHDLFTNGILYIDLGFNLKALPQDLVPYVPLFSRALTETGTQTETFVQLLQRIGRTTGGIRPSTLTSAKRGTNESIAYLILRGKAMLPHTGDILAILQDVLSGANIEDQDRFRQMALEEKARVESRLVNAGHIMVNNRLRSHFNEADWASEQMGGVSYLFFLRSLVQKVDNNWTEVLTSLQSIRDILLTGPNSICNVTLDSSSWQHISVQVQDFLNNLPVGSPVYNTWQIPAMPSSEGLTIPSQVNFVGKGANLFQHGYRMKGSALVINNHLNGSWIWDRIRVQGGAYGGFAVFDNQSGVFTYISYRDPNITQSLENYDASGTFLRGLELDDDEITKAIIGTIGDLDAYQLPDAKGYSSLRFHLLGLTDEERQRIRDEVLNTSREDFNEFAGILDIVKDHGAVAVLGDENAIRAAGIFEDIKKVL
jgi:presequence protease